MADPDEKKKTIGSSGLENNGRNDQALSTDDSKQSWIFHPHESSQDEGNVNQIPAIATIHGSCEYRRPCLAVKTNNGVFCIHARKGEQKAQISIEQKKKKCIWRNDESNMDNASKTKMKIKTKN